MSAISVLIVDDHPVVREGLVKMIGLYPDLKIVGEVSSGEEAVEEVRRLIPAVALMDVRMAGIGGVEATRRIRQQCPDTQVIVLSNYDEDRYVFDALRAGARGYLLKDVSADGLAEAIRAVARGESMLDSSLMNRVVSEFQQMQQRPQSPPDRLTPREMEVLQRLVDGFSNREIADHLVVSEKTVKSHLTSIYRKLNVRDRSQAIVSALRSGLVSVPDDSTF
ncbi:MAG: response regulator transcription factor [Dehalococcoidia bacterium]